MQFNSFIFILAFLPIFLIAYFAISKLNHQAGKLCIIFGSLLFYAYAGFNYALVLLISVVFNLIFSMLINRCKNSKAFLIIAIIINLALLTYFKYTNFLLSVFGIDASSLSFITSSIMLPLGISFFTFQQIMYLVNVYKKTIPQVKVIDYLAYILYFPKIAMGPLVEPTELISQLNEPANLRVNWDNIFSGVKVFCFGLFKKVILADTFSRAVTWGFSNLDKSTSLDWFIIMLSCSFEIYFDFSGYCDMALGVSTMLNVKLPINFDSPYKAFSIREFWKRWHISLTQFFTKYIYIPLGGNRISTYRTYLNILLVFLISGIWHGANWTFILWGVLHGALSIAERIFAKYESKVFQPVRWIMTFLAVGILWLLFFSNSISQWYEIVYRMFTFQSTLISEGVYNAFIIPQMPFIYSLLHIDSLNEKIRGLSLLIFMGASFAICLLPENNYKRLKNGGLFSAVFAALAFIFAFLSLSSESVFLYFNF